MKIRNEARAARAAEFADKNMRRKLTRSTPFGSVNARQERRKTGGAFGTEIPARQQACRGEK